MEKKKKFVFWKKADDKGMYLIEEQRGGIQKKKKVSYPCSKG